MLALIFGLGAFLNPMDRKIKKINKRLTGLVKNLKGTQIEFKNFKKTQIEFKNQIEDNKQNIKENKNNNQYNIDNLTTEIESEMAILYANITVAQEKIEENNGNIKETQDKVNSNMAILNENITDVQDNIKANTEIIDNILNTPTAPANTSFLYVCGYQDTVSSAGVVITYDKTMINYNNLGSNGLDIATGQFTSPVEGVYIITYSMMNDAGYNENTVDVYIRLNGNYITESVVLSLYSGSSGRVYENFGKDLTIYLNKGETLDLYWEQGNGYLYHITLCVTLAREVNGTSPATLMDLSTDEEVDIEDIIKNQNKTK